MRFYSLNNCLWNSWTVKKRIDAFKNAVKIERLYQNKPVLGVFEGILNCFPILHNSRRYFSEIFQTFVCVFGLSNDGSEVSRARGRAKLSEYSRYCLPCDKAIFRMVGEGKEADRVRFCKD